jgi:hypothetical protein
MQNCSGEPAHEGCENFAFVNKREGRGLHDPAQADPLEGVKAHGIASWLFFFVDQKTFI